MLSIPDHWVFISLDYATFGVAVKDHHIVEAAPIARWAIGKHERVVAEYYRKRGARFVRLG